MNPLCPLNFCIFGNFIIITIIIIYTFIIILDVMLIQEGPPDEKGTDEIVASMANFIRENSFILELGSITVKVNIKKIFV